MSCTCRTAASIPRNPKGPLGSSRAHHIHSCTEVRQTTCLLNLLLWTQSTLWTVAVWLIVGWLLCLSVLIVFHMNKSSPLGHFSCDVMSELDWFSTVALLLDGDFTDNFLFLFFCFLEMRTVAPGYITGPLIYKKTQPGTWLKLVSSMIHPLFTDNLHNFLCILSQSTPFRSKWKWKNGLFGSSTTLVWKQCINGC